MGARWRGVGGPSSPRLTALGQRRCGSPKRENSFRFCLTGADAPLAPRWTRGDQRERSVCPCSVGVFTIFFSCQSVVTESPLLQISLSERNLGSWSESRALVPYGPAGRQAGLGGLDAVRSEHGRIGLCVPFPFASAMKRLSLMSSPSGAGG